MTIKLILASSSPYRRALLERLGLSFESISPDIDESSLLNEEPEDTALRLAQQKAKKIAEIYPSALIIGCDQVATLAGKHIGKPFTQENAVKQLQDQQGRSVIFYSALCLYNPSQNRMQAEVVPYEVKFRALNDAQIENYLRIEEPYDCAGSAKSEGLGIALIETMTGSDPNALIGLPLIKLISMLKNENIGVI